MLKSHKLSRFIIISNVLLFIVFLVAWLFGVGDLDWDKAKIKVNKYVMKQY
ncbi:hypothetical protein [Fusibacter bizertensis]